MRISDWSSDVCSSDLQIRQRQHHAIADEAGDSGPHDAGRNQVQRGLDAVDDQRMAGIVATLETHDRLDAIGEQVNDLALALITPLSPDDDDGLTHGSTPGAQWGDAPVALRSRRDTNAAHR